MKIRFFVMILIVLFLNSCVINKMAMNVVSNALTGDGSSDVFTGDPDPKLVGDAIPFAIKMYESLLSANPKHQGLMLTTGSLFVMYANAFVQGPAEMLPNSEWEEREAALMRAKQMYLRGYEILSDALEAKFRGFKQASIDRGNLQSILQKCKKGDAGLLYWTVAGGLAAYSIDILDFNLSANIPDWSAMIKRAYELDPDFGGASLDEFFILFYASLPEMLGGNLEQAKIHYQRALDKTRGNSVSAYVAYAQNISIPAQDYDTFRDNLEKALAINPDANISTRLVTTITQKKAKWLLDNAWVYFSFLPIPDDY
jgi:predicted anti-sigma-YlaC factor YlaD